MSYQSPPQDNGRVLSTLIQELTREVRTGFQKLESRMAFLEEKQEIRLDEIDKRHQADVKEMASKCQVLGERVTRNEERITSGNRIIGAGTVVGSVVAAIVGAFVK